VIDDSDAQVESAGPLAGLRGLLPAEAEIIQFRKPPVYSVKLRVAEDQQARVALLEEIIAAEGQPKPIPTPSAFSSQAILRLVTALTIILAVIYSLWLGTQQVKLPEAGLIKDQYPEVFNFRDQINKAGNTTPALLVFDYDAAFSAEIEASASSMVESLGSRGMYLTLVSTSPTGPILAERFMKKLNPSIRYTNLGYIAGGTAGLLGFAQKPSDTIPYSLDQVYTTNEESVWISDTLPLKDIKSNTLAGFSLIIVMTNEPDTARAWVEQTQAARGDRPLLMVVSAQIEALVRPYYDSKQIKGLIAGLSGGAAYESLSGGSGRVRQYWDAYSTALLAGSLLILVGGLVSAAMTIRTYLKNTKGEEPS
jgi:hypothetical protein